MKWSRRLITIQAVVCAAVVLSLTACDACEDGFSDSGPAWQVWEVRDALYLRPSVAGTPTGGVLAIAVNNGERDPSFLGSDDSYSGKPRAMELGGDIWRINGTIMVELWPDATERIDLVDRGIDIGAHDADWNNRGLETIAIGIDSLPILPDAVSGSPTLSSDTRIFHWSYNGVELCSAFVGGEREQWESDARVVFSANNIPIRIAP